MANLDLSGAGWRKSSRSGGNGGACIEVATVWRRSSHSGSSGGQCVEVATWHKSSHSGSSGGNCVEVGGGERAVVVRDSKDPDGPVLAFGPRAWRSFAEGVKAGRR